MSGGTRVILSGPCFRPQDPITCTFTGSSQMNGSYISVEQALCITPAFERTGRVDLMVTIWDPYNLELRYSMQTEFFVGECNSYINQINQ